VERKSPEVGLGGAGQEGTRRDGWVATRNGKAKNWVLIVTVCGWLVS
jgi:hypothetical protein